LENSIIAHGAGIIDGTKHSNSLEAIRNASVFTDLIEIDLVPSKDGLIVAHNNLESHYGMKKKFWNVTTNEFLTSKYKGRFTTLSFEDLVKLSLTLGSKFIIDVKPKEDGYEKCILEIAAICSKYEAFGNFIVQVYCEDDYLTVTVKNLPFHGVMIALWKYHSNIYAKKAALFCTFCAQDSQFDFIGTSVFFKRLQRGGTIKDVKSWNYFKETGLPIYVHGQPEEFESDLLDMGYGIFTHFVDRSPSGAGLMGPAPR